MVVTRIERNRLQIILLCRMQIAPFPGYASKAAENARVGPVREMHDIFQRFASVIEIALLAIDLRKHGIYFHVMLILFQTFEQQLLRFRMLALLEVLARGDDAFFDALRPRYLRREVLTIPKTMLLLQVLQPLVCAREKIAHRARSFDEESVSKRSP